MFERALSRREFLRVGGGLAVSAGLAPRFVQAGSPTGGARSCIFIYLLGGPPHLDMFDLKPNAAAEVRGPFQPVSTTLPGVQVCEHLPRLAKLAQRYALVRSVSHNNHNHTPMIYYTLTGREVERPNEDNDVRPAAAARSSASRCGPGSVQASTGRIAGLRGNPGIGHSQQHQGRV